MIAIRKLAEYASYSKRKAQEGHLPVYRQLFEMLLLYGRRGLGPGYYHFGRFWRRSIPLRDKLRHLNEADYKQAVTKINPVAYHKLSQHKVVEKALLAQLGLPTPTFLGHLDRLKGSASDGSTLTNAAELESWLLRYRPKRLCFKPVEGWGGSGFLPVECCYEDGDVRLRLLGTEKIESLRNFYTENLAYTEQGHAYILEEYCEQHSWYSAANPSSLNTIRLYARLRDEGIVDVLGGYLRLDRSGAVVDNASAGGVFCPIDIARGVLAPARFNDYDSPDMSRHPDSGVLLAGAVLPMWGEVLDLSRRCLRCFPGVHFAGLDIAVTPIGPVVIELNVEPGRTAACDIDLPTLDMLDPPPSSSRSNCG